MSNNIRITKEFKFEMAHALPNHKGLCKNVHGHSYVLAVTLLGNAVDDLSRGDHGMVMDFGDLKKIVHEHVISVFDHALVLYNGTSEQLVNELKNNFNKLILVDYHPTSEQMILDIKERIATHLPHEIKLVKLHLRETATAYAEWYAEDN
jgi:6-pyruvoyltetrahydropterin/6-carboxytetrahydropterin synthase